MYTRTHTHAHTHIYIYIKSIYLHIYIYDSLENVATSWLILSWFGRGELTMASQKLSDPEKEGTKFSSPCLPLSLPALSSQGRTSSMSSTLAKEASRGFWTCTAWRCQLRETLENSKILLIVSSIFHLIWFLAGIWEGWSDVGREDRNYLREVTCKEQVWPSCI